MGNEINVEKFRDHAWTLNHKLEEKLREFIEENYEELLSYRKMESKKYREDDQPFREAIEGMENTSCEVPAAIKFMMEQDLLRKISRDSK